MIDSNSPLNQIFARTVAAKEKRPVCVFDLDHTLFDNGARTWQIMLEFARENQRDDLEKALHTIPKTGLEYLLSSMLTRIGFADEALHKDAFKFWFDRFFTDDYQKYDTPLPGAADFVGALYDAGATIVYLTGRDVPGMLTGCTESLRAHGFPVGLMRTVSVLKPDFETPDFDFKRDAVSFISDLGEITGAFENEPGNANLFADAWGVEASIFMTTECAPNPPKLYEGIREIADFNHFKRSA